MNLSYIVISYVGYLKTLKNSYLTNKNNTYFTTKLFKKFSWKMLIPQRSQTRKQSNSELPCKPISENPIQRWWHIKE